MHHDPQAAAGDEDPFEVHCRREPLTGAAVRVVVLDSGDPEHAERIAAGLVELLTQRRRKAEARVAPASSDRRQALALALADADAFPIVMITNATAPWTPEHLDPLLSAIDKADHVIGRRPGGSIASTLSRWLRKLIFAVPVRDVHSPCRIHRRAKLAVIPLQSASAFADVEVLAKATFLGQLLDEVPVPPLPAVRGACRLADCLEVFRKPVFVPPSIPAEDPQGDHEGDDGPGGQDQERIADGEQRRALQDHATQGDERLSQG